jgi:hypothetical protein
MSTGPRQFKLLYRGNTVWLPPGQLFLGRSCNCHIVIDDPLVSRRHAQLTVDGQRVLIEDLSSINGVFVNGERLLEEQYVLREGDRIQLGDEGLVFGSGPLGVSDFPQGRDTVSGVDPVVPAEADAGLDGPTSAEPTARADGVVLMGSVADRALAKGQVREAEQMLSSVLTNLLSDALRGKSVPEETVPVAIGYAMKLAWATRQGEWFDYVAELLYTTRRPIPADLAATLHAALERVTSVNVPRLRRYVKALVSQHPAPSTAQQQQIAEAQQLLAAAERLHR